MSFTVEERRIRKNERGRLWRLNNPEKQREMQRNWRLTHAEEHREKNNAYQRERNAKHPELVKAVTRSQRLKRYGMTINDYKTLWDEQDGKCAICGIQFTEPSKGCVDHNHKTGEVRGLLCHPCNSAIGYFRDSIESIKKAIIYLEGR